MPSNRARFDVVEDGDNVLIIQDIGPWSNYPSVTNDAEAVVRSLAPVLNDRRLYYYDSEGDICELRVVDGKFAGFAFGGPV